LWVFEGEVTVTGFVVDSRRLVLGMGGWAEAAAQRLAGPPGDAPPESVQELSRLLGRVGLDRNLILGAMIPEGTRKRLLAQPAFSAQASVLRLGGAADLGPNLRADVVAELSNAADAQVLVAQFQTFLREIKGRPQMLLLGAGPFLDAASAQTEGPNARFGLSLDEARTGDLIARVMGVLRLGLAVSGAKTGSGR
jgi:hypothetical protein